MPRKKLSNRSKGQRLAWKTRKLKAASNWPFDIKTKRSDSGEFAEDTVLTGFAQAQAQPATGLLSAGTGMGNIRTNPTSNTNPKTLMGEQKVPILSVVPATSIIAQATAMRYGAYLAPKADGTHGYGPYNWRDQPIEGHIYIDAAMRHLMQWFDGEDYEIVRDAEGRGIDIVSHLAFALATIGIIIDAQANNTLIDDRPKGCQQSASKMLNSHKLPRYTK